MNSSDQWLQIRRTNITSIDALADYLELDASLRAELLKHTLFPLNLPLRLAQKIAKNTLDDPLFKQFVPLLNEEAVVEGYTTDPVSETTFCKSPNLIQKYRSRSLLIPTQACGMHCRYCFRRHFDYQKGRVTLDDELALIAQDPTLTEVILSGGDPLSLLNHQLADLLEKLSRIPHIKRVRFHTRLPIGIPERIDAPLLANLEKLPLQIVFVIHCNHVRELDPDVLQALRQLRLLGIPLLCQSVLLRGVNDTPGALLSLFETLGDNGIIPYYLHQLDPVHGAAHFHVPETEGLALMHHLQKSLSGYCLPRYVKEVPGELHKTLIF